MWALVENHSVGAGAALKVSIVVPTFNRPKYLAVALESIRRQTYRDYDVIVVDDGGSTPESKDIAKFYNANYVWKYNGGIASSLNTGILSSEGEWIKWLSDDDFLHPEYLEKMLAGEGDIRYCPYWLVDEAGEILSLFREPRYDNWKDFAFRLWIGHVGNGSSTLIRRGVFDKVGLFDESLRFHEDYDWWLRAVLKHKYMFKLVDEPLLYYRVHQGQLTRAVAAQAFQQNEAIRKRYLEYLPE